MNQMYCTSARWRNRKRAQSCLGTCYSSSAFSNSIRSLYFDDLANQSLEIHTHVSDIPNPFPWRSAIDISRFFALHLCILIIHIMTDLSVNSDLQAVDAFICYASAVSISVTK